jgi:dihydrofolate reductase
MSTGMNIVVAVDEGGGFAKEGKIPWHFSEDLQHFKKLTNNSVCIMGRRTYLDIVDVSPSPNEILPGRTLYVISSTIQPDDQRINVFTSLRSAVEDIEKRNLKKPIFVIGGEKLFIEAMPWTTTVYMTIVPGYYKCDRFFPIKYLINKFRISSGELGKEVKFVTYTRSAN